MSGQPPRLLLPIKWCSLAGLLRIRCHRWGLWGLLGSFGTASWGAGEGGMTQEVADASPWLTRAKGGWGSVQVPWGGSAAAPDSGLLGGLVRDMQQLGAGMG